VDQDGGKSIVEDACWFAGFLDAVAVVPGAFDRPWTGSTAASIASRDTVETRTLNDT